MENFKIKELELQNEVLKQKIKIMELENKLEYIARETDYNQKVNYLPMQIKIKELESGLYENLQDFQDLIEFLLDNKLFSFKTYLQFDTVLDAANLGISTIPKGIRFMKGLRELLLNENELGYFPDGILELTGLRTLIINDNKITRLPENLSNLHNLKILSISNLKLDLKSFEYIKFPNLEYLYCRNTSNNLNEDDIRNICTIPITCNVFV